MWVEPVLVIVLVATIIVAAGLFAVNITLLRITLRKLREAVVTHAVELGNLHKVMGSREFRSLVSRVNDATLIERR